MIAARPFQDLTRGLGRNAFDLPVAALAGLAAAVVAFAMPGDLLGQLVSATGLPHLLAAASRRSASRPAARSALPAPPRPSASCS